MVGGLACKKVSRGLDRPQRFMKFGIGGKKVGQAGNES